MGVVFSESDESDIDGSLIQEVLIRVHCRREIISTLLVSKRCLSFKSSYLIQNLLSPILDADLGIQLSEYSGGPVRGGAGTHCVMDSLMPGDNNDNLMRGYYSYGLDDPHPSNIQVLTFRVLTSGLSGVFQAPALSGKTIGLMLPIMRNLLDHPEWPEIPGRGINPPNILLFTHSYTRSLELKKTFEDLSQFIEEVTAITSGIIPQEHFDPPHLTSRLLICTPSDFHRLFIVNNIPYDTAIKSVIFDDWEILGSTQVAFINTIFNKMPTKISLTFFSSTLDAPQERLACKLLERNGPSLFPNGEHSFCSFREDPEDKQIQETIRNAVSGGRIPFIHTHREMVLPEYRLHPSNMISLFTIDPTKEKNIEAYTNEEFQEAWRAIIMKPDSNLRTKPRFKITTPENFAFELKMALLIDLLFASASVEPTIIFFNSVATLERVFDHLEASCWKTKQIKRFYNEWCHDENLDNFKHGYCLILLTLDPFALNIGSVRRVVNFDVPSTAQKFITRTSNAIRYGKSGSVVSLIAPEEEQLMEAVHQYLDDDVYCCTLERFLRPKQAWERKPRVAGGALDLW